MAPRIPIIALFALPLLVVGVVVAAANLAAEPVGARNATLRIDLPPPGGQIGLPPIAGPADTTRPLVVIDAGHGGHDPGAVREDLREKAVTLALARVVRDRLVTQGGIRVALTRDEDRFLALAERTDLARRMNADLFLSIHADAADTEEAAGATVYTLAQRASDPQAAALAARENLADRINGVSLSGQSDAVGRILLDLSQRRTREASDAFARLIRREGEAALPFRGNPQRSAAFVVLKAPDMPAVLFEAGYLSNADDAERLSSPEGQNQFADVMAQAIRIYFARSSARG